MTFQDQDQPSSRVLVGKIAQPHGVKGLVKLLPFVEDVSLLEHVYTSEDGDQTLSLKIKNPLGKYLLAEIEGITDRNAVEALGKLSLYISRDEAAEAEELVSLEGLPVQDEAGEVIGSVKSIENYGASDLLDIQLKTGKSVMVPLSDDFVPEITDEYVVITNYEAFL